MKTAQDSKGRQGSQKSAASVKTAPSTIRKNIVSSVKGTRRAEAMQRMGLVGKSKISKSMRVVEGDE